MLGAGWLLAKGVEVVSDDFCGVTWAVGNMGVKWQGTVGLGGGIALLADSRGGILELLSVAVMQPTNIFQGNFLTIDRADQYRFYSRWSAEEAVAANKFVGLNVTVGGVTNLVGIQMDTLGAAPLDTDFCFVGAQAGAGTTVTTGLAYTTDMQIWEFVMSGTSITCLRNGTVVATLTTGQYPLAGARMQVVANTVCLGASVNSQLHIDVIKVVESRYTGVGDV